MGPIYKSSLPGCNINSSSFLKNDLINQKFFAINTIVFDIDGTILTSKNQIQSGLKENLEILSSKGINILLASARPLTSILNIGKNLGISLPVIGLNGSIIADYNKIIFRQSFDTLKIIETINNYEGISINYYSDYDWYVDKIDDNIVKESELVWMEPKIPIKKIKKAQKILLIGERNVLEKIRKDLLSLNEIEVHFSKINYLEINPKGVNKLNSIKNCLSFMNLSDSSVMAIGDGENDIPMLREFNLGIAMGNSPEIVQNSADLIIKSNDENGLVEFIEFFNKSRGFF